MRKMIGLFFVLACCVAVSSAQQPTPAALAKWDVFAGYSFSRLYLANAAPFPMNLNGGQGAVTHNFTRHLGATAEFSGYTNDVDGLTISSQSYLFGPVARFGFKNGKNPRVSFFAQQLFGVTHFSATEDDGSGCISSSPTCKTNPFTMASGGGVDIKLNKHFSVRPLQMEYYNERISMDSIGGLFFAIPVSPGPRLLAHPYGSGSTGIKLLADGFRYTGGAVYRF
ncbi:MAG: outer membrane beta-barrel protein [Terracidiphilus sp.]|jgi:hypothetical protein